MLSQDLGQEFLTIRTGVLKCSIALRGIFIVVLFCTLWSHKYRVEGWRAWKNLCKMVSFFPFFDIDFLFLSMINWFSSVVFYFFRDFWKYFECDILKRFTPRKVLQLWYLVWERSFNFGTLRVRLIPWGTLSRRGSHWIYMRQIKIIFGIKIK